MEDYSIVEIFDGPIEAHHCGYCKSKGSLSYGMWAHNLTVRDYQALIDRGWRRSGKYCYKPVMHQTCCPLYTIKCAALEIQLSKSHKKILRRMHRFLGYGDSKEENLTSKQSYADDQHAPLDSTNILQKAGIAEHNMHDKTIDKQLGSKPENKPQGPTSSTNPVSCPSSISTMSHIASGGCPIAKPAVTRKQPALGTGPDPKLPQCKKAKLIRREKKLEKLAKKSEQTSTPNLTMMNAGEKNVAKTLQDYLAEPLPSDAMHKLEVKLVRCWPRSPEFKATMEETYNVFALYQRSIHQETDADFDKNTYFDFLVNSPLEPVETTSSHPGYGSFHQQYWLDGKLIAVGVIDILPSCISSVYFYYDPKYNFLSLGTYGALREIAFTQELSKMVSELQYYYMGYYVHSCQKMRYKGHYNPSMLLCPEAYTWHPIQQVLKKLDEKKYCRLEERDLDDQDAIVDLNEVMVLHRRTALPYYIYLSLKHTVDTNESEEVFNYAQLVGKKCVSNMLLYRK